MIPGKHMLHTRVIPRTCTLHTRTIPGTCTYETWYVHWCAHTYHNLHTLPAVFAYGSGFRLYCTVLLLAKTREKLPACTSARTRMHHLGHIGVAMTIMQHSKNACFSHTYTYMPEP